jgi:hypothetical protein
MCPLRNAHLWRFTEVVIEFINWREEYEVALSQYIANTKHLRKLRVCMHSAYCGARINSSALLKAVDSGARCIEEFHFGAYKEPERLHPLVDVDFNVQLQHILMLNRQRRILNPRFTPIVKWMLIFSIAYCDTRHSKSWIFWCSLSFCGATSGTCKALCDSLLQESRLMSVFRRRGMSGLDYCMWLKVTGNGQDA